MAVSGGADSVALLDLLSRCRRPALSLVVAHLNHTLRGAASDEDEVFVASLAEHYRFPFVSRRSDVAGIARERKLSLEEAGRCARYEFFAEVAANSGATSIALAHHRDDQAETVLMRLLRGAGGTGLAGMRPVAQGMLKRPLLGICRSELEEYLRVHQLTWRNDESNADTAFLRNSIRHELIPMLRRYNPLVTDRLCATAEILAADEELLQEVTEAAYNRYCRETDEGVFLPCESVAREPRGLRLRLYRQAIATVKGDLTRIGLSHLESLDELLVAASPSSRLHLPDGLTVSRRYAELLFCRKGEITSTLSHQLSVSWPVAIPEEGRYPLPDGRAIVVQQVPRPATLLPPSPDVAFMSLEGVPFPLVVRGVTPGDRFRPLGLDGEQKVKELLINRKIPRDQRVLVPLLFSGGNLVWVGGIRLSEAARVADEATEVLRVELLPCDP